MLLPAFMVPSSSLWWSDRPGALHTINHIKGHFASNFDLIAETAEN